jgi:microcystin degradation protein MlrC
VRIAIGEFSHETSSFAPGITETEAFKQRQWLVGDEIVKALRGVRNDLGGMIDAAERLGIELAPAFATHAEPSGLITRATYDEISAELIDQLTAAGPVDAICLALHGAGCADGIDDLEGAVLGQIREAVGPEIPILVTLDLHGNTTNEMVEHATVLLYCHEYPHIDRYERGVEAVELAAKIVRGEIAPAMHFEKLPALLPPGQTTFFGPAKTVNERCFAREAEPGVIDCAFTHGFPGADLPITRTSILVTTDNDPALAERVAKDVADLVLGMIEEFRVELPGADEAVAQALAATELPVVMAEVSDNPGGGAPGNGTHLLRALLAANVPRTAFGYIYDPAVAAQAHAAGTGATIHVKLGGFTHEVYGAPIEAEAYVKCLTDGEFVLTSPMGAGNVVRLGKMARLVIGNVDVIVGSERTQTLDPGPFLLHGIDVTTYRIAALKSHQHFRGGFTGIAGTVIRVDTPGLGSTDLTKLPFTRLDRPLWPFDPLPAS